jgi:hypothetical protein
MDGEPVPLGHAHRLVLHGAGVGVDVEGGWQGYMAENQALSASSSVMVSR